MANDRPYDVVVFGATGFTGGLVVEYLARTYSDSVKWAIAGRNRGKLAAIKHAATQIDPACEAIGVIVADNNDPTSLAEMTGQAKVVLTTVGPYADYGEPLVRACIDARADYVDITGEPEFVDGMVAVYDDAARAKGVRIVNCCGFDSIPHDLGVLYTVRKLPSDQPISIEGFVQAKGTFSGGTWQSAVKAMGRLREAQAMKAASRSAGHADSNPRRVRGIKPRFRYNRKVGGWVFPMPTIDPEIVRRSARTLADYGPDFSYGHYGKSSSLPKIMMGAAGIGAVVALAQFEPTRNWLLGRRQSGAGPTEKQRDAGWFKVTFVAEAGDRELVTRVSGGDPGYAETSKMVAESALCLALDGDKLPRHTGVLTPAVAMGDALMVRLRERGIRFEVVEG